MKAILSGILAAVAVAVVASFVLAEFQKPVDSAYATTSVRN